MTHINARYAAIADGRRSRSPPEPGPHPGAIGNRERALMLEELDVLEARRIADLGEGAQKVRGRLLQGVRAADLGEPSPARGTHNPGAALPLEAVLAETPEYRALHEAIQGLPHEILAKLWVTAQVGRGDLTINDCEGALEAAELLRNEELLANMLAEADLHDCLRKGLFVLGETDLPGDAG